MHAVSPEALRQADLDIVGAEEPGPGAESVDAAYINARDQLILFPAINIFGTGIVTMISLMMDSPQNRGRIRHGGRVHRGRQRLPYDIDTAVKTAAGTVFLFKDNQYVMSHDHGAKKEVKELLGAVRTSAPTAEGANISVDAAFVAPDGKTYLFKGDQYIRYSQFDNAYVDEGFPKRIKDNWGNLPVEYEVGRRRHCVRRQDLSPERKGAVAGASRPSMSDIPAATIKKSTPSIPSGWSTVVEIICWPTFKS